MTISSADGGDVRQKRLVSGASIDDRISVVFAVAVLLGLYVASLKSYLLFHTLAEFMFMFVALAVVVMAWNLREFLADDYPLFLGVSLAAVAVLRLVHTLEYKGMGVFDTVDPNHATQLWIASAGLAAVSLLISPWVIGRRVRFGLLAGAYLAVTTAVLLSIYVWRVFPTAYEHGGLTTLKKVSEYVVCLLLVGAAGALWRRRRPLIPTTVRFMIAAILVWALSEFFFTLYVGVYTTPNLIGHLLSVLSALMIYRAVVHAGLAQPHAMAVAALQLSEQTERDAARLHQRLETGLLPALPLSHRSLSIMTRYQPGEERLNLCGDFIDLADLEDGRLALIVGDVSGHGPDAAALGATLRASWQALALRGASFAETVEILERVLRREAPSPETFATCLLALLDPAQRRLDILSLGHPAPLVIDRDVTELDLSAYPPLGVAFDTSWREKTVSLPPDASLLFFTDGLIEGWAAPDTRERLGSDGLRRLVLDEASHGRCDEAMLDRVLLRVVTANDGPLPDDIAVVMVCPISVRDA